MLWRPCWIRWPSSYKQKVNKMNSLIEISTNHPNPVISPSLWRHAEFGKTLCADCHRVDRTKYPRSFDVKLEEYPHHVITGSVWDIGVKIFHIDFIEQIKPYLAHYVLGKCYDEKNKLIKQYVTCYGRDYIVARGNKQSNYYVCKSCGAVSSSGWHGMQYTLREYLSDPLIYQNVSCSMFIDDDLALKLDFSAWPDAVLEPIAIKDEPMDGQCLPCDKSFRKKN